MKLNCHLVIEHCNKICSWKIWNVETRKYCVFYSFHENHVCIIESIKFVTESWKTYADQFNNLMVRLASILVDYCPVKWMASNTKKFVCMYYKILQKGNKDIYLFQSSKSWFTISNNFPNCSLSGCVIFGTICCITIWKSH